jgi:hypothetical protein
MRDPLRTERLVLGDQHAPIDCGLKERSLVVLAMLFVKAKGVKLSAGAKVVAALTTPAKKAITVRFTVKSSR